MKARTRSRSTPTSASTAARASRSARRPRSSRRASCRRKWNVYKDINALVSGAKKVGEIDIAAWPEHLKAQAASATTWPNITEQKKPLPGADDAAKEENKIAALTLEGGE